jgi:hypothetical protein
MDADALACRFVGLKKRRSKLTAEAKAIREEEAEVAQQLANFFEQSGLKQFKSQKGPSVHVKDVLRVWYLVRNKNKVLEWLGENGYGEYVKPTVNDTSFKAIIAERLDAGLPVPTFVKYAYYPDVGYAANGYEEEV